MVPLNFPDLCLGPKNPFLLICSRAVTGEVTELLNVGAWVKCLCACPGVLCVQEKSV